MEPACSVKPGLLAAQETPPDPGRPQLQMCFALMKEQHLLGDQEVDVEMKGSNTRQVSRGDAWQPSCIE